MSQLLNTEIELNEEIIQSLFPCGISVSISALTGSVYQLYKEEAELIDHAIHKRQTEFASGRLCAKDALKGLEINDFPILMDEKRAPVWPGGVSGSITHTRDICVAVAAKVKEGQSLGIDVEEGGRLSENLWEHSFVEEEIEWLRALGGGEDPIKWATMMFAAKEAFYKAQYPLTKAWVGFRDVKLEFIDDEQGAFYVELLIDLHEAWKKGVVFKGRYVFCGEHVAAGVLVDF